MAFLSSSSSLSLSLSLRIKLTVAHNSSLHLLLQDNFLIAESRDSWILRDTERCSGLFIELLFQVLFLYISDLFTLVSLFFYGRAVRCCEAKSRREREREREREERREKCTRFVIKIATLSSFRAFRFLITVASLSSSGIHEIEVLLSLSLLLLRWWFICFSLLN